MAHVSEQEIRQIQSEVSITRLVESAGLVPQADGVTICPFCQNPTLTVDIERNTWSCGSCQPEPKNVIDWIMKIEKISCRHAVELSRKEHFGVNSIDKSQVQKLPSVFDPDTSDAELLRQVVDYYHQMLKDSPEALQYLQQRGLTSQEMIDRFHFGFANRTVGYHLPSKEGPTGKRIRAQLRKVGILRASGHEHFNGSIVIPIFDENGQVQQIYGRKITARLRHGTAQHLYLPGEFRGVWNIQAFKAMDEIILCESLIDALTLWCCGYRNVTASYGVDGFTEDHWDAFRRYNIQRVLIAYDRDEEGDRAADELAQKLIEGGFTCFRIQLPNNMDINEYAFKAPPAEKSLGAVIRGAAWLGNGVVKTAQAIPTDDEPILDEDDNQADDQEVEPAAENEDEPAEKHPPVATHLPPMSCNEIPTEIKDEEILIHLGDRRYRIRGLSKNMSYDMLKVNLFVAFADARNGVFVDTFDLYSAKHRNNYVRQAAEELNVKEAIIKKDLGKVLMKLEQLQDEQITQKLTPTDDTVRMDVGEKEKALAFLKNPNLLDQILADFETCGVVGEETNKLMAYLACVSRLLEQPLGVVIQSMSAAGKTSLMDAVLAFMPDEQRVQYSAMTGQSLFYMGVADLKHKILAIAEDVGVERASYALKLLQSEGYLTIASTSKDKTGRLVTEQYRVEGPVQLLMTTTAIDIEEELLNRCVVLAVNEDRDQTKAIHAIQRRQQTLDGLLEQQDRQEILKVHRNAQRLLKPVWVVNPYANDLTFLDTKTRLRRDHIKYLTLIKTIALLHQHQRPTQTIYHNGQTHQYIEVTLDDIAMANKLAHEVLGRSLDDLTPQTRKLLLLINDMVAQTCQTRNIDRDACHFSRKDVRQFTGWSDFQVRTHLRKLALLEYLLVHRGGRGQSFEYELLYDGEGENGQPFMMGLADTEQLRTRYDAKVEHQNHPLEHALSIQSAPIEPGSGSEELGVSLEQATSSVLKPAVA